MHKLPHLGDVAHAVSQDYDHAIGIAITFGPDRGIGYAVIHQGPDTVLAWDGGYGTKVDAAHLTPLDELESLEDRDDMVSRVLLPRTRALLPELALYLQPSYSFTEMARTILAAHGDEPDPGGSGHHAVAYFPTDLTADEAMRIIRS